VPSSPEVLGSATFARERDLSRALRQRAATVSVSPRHAEEAAELLRAAGRGVERAGGLAQTGLRGVQGLGRAAWEGAGILAGKSPVARAAVLGSGGLAAGMTVPDVARQFRGTYAALRDPRAAESLYR